MFTPFIHIMQFHIQTPDRKWTQNWETDVAAEAARGCECASEEFSPAWGWSAPSTAGFTPDTWGEQMPAGHLCWSTVYTTTTTTTTTLSPSTGEEETSTRYQESCWLSVPKCASQRIHQNNILVKNPNTITKERKSFKILKYIHLTSGT